MAVSRPLAVAIAAMVLLVGSVTFDAVFHRTYRVDVHDAQGWQTIGTAGGGQPGKSALASPRGAHPVIAARNATLEFRLRVDNGYPWSYSGHYDVAYNGVGIADGDISAPARGVGESPFTIPAASLYAGGTASVEPTKGAPGSNVTYPYFSVEIGNVVVSANFELQAPEGG